MGTWGSKNFQNDTAGDYYLQHVDRMLDEIRQAMNGETQLHAGSYWCDVLPCMIEMIAVLGQQDFHYLGLDADEIKQWKQKFMDQWRLTIDDCAPEEKYRTEREQVLNETFDKLIALAEQI